MLLDRSQTTLGSATRPHTRGKYRVFAELARGGMSVVYLAYARANTTEPTGPAELLVLKELRSELAADPAVLAMFVEEGRLAARLHHPNVVRTVDRGEADGRQYIVMEYLEGQSLQRVLSRFRSRGAPLPLDFLGAVLCGILEGLMYAHGAADHDGTPLGIVHRDMSPHNVVVGFDGRVKILDFGIAKAAHSGIEARTGILQGKVPYMSPEQAAGTDVDLRSDLFAVGVMLWEAVIGQRFWAGTSSVAEILEALWQGTRPVELEEALARSPSVLRSVISRSVAMDPADRYPTAQEMLADLRAALIVSGAAPFGPSDVARIMCDQFREDRARLKTAIDEALASHPRSSGEHAAVSIPRPAGGVTLRPEPIPADFSMREPKADEQGPDTARPVVLVEQDEPLAARSPRFDRTAAFKLGTAAMAGAALTLLLLPGHSGSRGGNLASALASPPAAPSTATSARERVAKEVVHVTVRATPAQARVAIDRQRASGNPCLATMPKDGTAHTVHVEADGYFPEDHTFPADADTAIIVSLQRKPR